MSDVVTFSPEEAGELVGKSANWMMTEARAGRISYTRIGRSVRFTPQHLAEIVRAGEQRPRPQLAARTPARRKDAAGNGVTLQAKTPRRKRSAA